MTIRPVRLQLKRTKGFNARILSVETNGLPYRVVTRATPYGNPYRVVKPDARGAIVGRTAEEAVALFRLKIRTWSDAAFDPLRGHNLFCTCPLDQPCHADVLIERANS